MLRLDGEGSGVVLTQVGRFPESPEEIETKLLPNGLFDDLAVALAGAGRPDAHGPKDVVVDRERRSHLRHACIIAS